MAPNPVGYVCPFDGGVPRIVTGTAQITISGGGLVFASGAADNISSGLSSIASNDITVANGASGLAFNGVAVATTASGAAVGIATRGLVVVRANGTVTNGYPVMCDGNDAVANVGSTTMSIVSNLKVGRAWSSATSGNYALVEITP